MLESIGSFVAAVKNAGPTLYAAAFVTSILLLFLPDITISQMGLTEFRAAHRSELGILLVGSASLLVAHTAFAISGLLKSKWRERRFQRNAQETLRGLTEEEKRFLRPYILDGENTRYESIYDGVANGLQAKGVIYRASNLSVPGVPGLLFPWNLQPFAREALSGDPNLLD